MRVVFHRYVHCKEAGTIDLIRDAELPFIPQPGQLLSFCDTVGCCTGLTVLDEPTFHVPTQLWHVTFGDEEDVSLSFEDCVKTLRHLLGTGWEARYFSNFTHAQEAILNEILDEE